MATPADPATILPRTLLLANVAETFTGFIGVEVLTRSRAFSTAQARGSTRGWEGRRRCTERQPTARRRRHRPRWDHVRWDQVPAGGSPPAPLGAARGGGGGPAA